MAGGYRVLIVGALAALVFTVFGLGWISGYALNNPTNERHQPYRYAADKPLEIDPATARGANSKPFEYRSPCDNPKGQTESDLCAQWKAANAAENSAFWTKWGFWIGVIGSALLLWQIILTREAVEDTSQATKAMERQNDIAEDTAKRQLRAYVDLKSADLSLCTEGKFPSDCAHPEQRFADVVIQNYGLTPARNLVSAAGVCVKPFPPTEANPVGPIPEWVERAVGELPPGRTNGLPLEVTRSGPLYEGLIKGELAVYFYGEISYEDIFGETHHTTISLVSHGISFKRNSFTVAKQGNHSD